MTRKERVSAALRSAARDGRLYVRGRSGHAVFDTPDGWIDGWLLRRPEIGGSGGLRRVRELRGEGEQIEMRPHPIDARYRQYRLVVETDPTLF